MAHEIESMFYAGAKPWHNLGAAVAEAPTTAEAIKLAGLDWGVKTIQLQIPAEGDRPAIPVGARAIVRETDLKVLRTPSTPKPKRIAGPSQDPAPAADDWTRQGGSR